MNLSASIRFAVSQRIAVRFFQRAHSVEMNFDIGGIQINYAYWDLGDADLL